MGYTAASVGNVYRAKGGKESKLQVTWVCLVRGSNPAPPPPPPIPNSNLQQNSQLPCSRILGWSSPLTPNKGTLPTGSPSSVNLIQPARDPRLPSSHLIFSFYPYSRDGRWSLRSQPPLYTSPRHYCMYSSPSLLEVTLSSHSFLSY